jgi:hypothetical protein
VVGQREEYGSWSWDGRKKGRRKKVKQEAWGRRGG